jgi:hypothetical protein
MEVEENHYGREKKEEKKTFCRRLKKKPSFNPHSNGGSVKLILSSMPLKRP